MAVTLLVKSYGNKGNMVEQQKKNIIYVAVRYNISYIPESHTMGMVYVSHYIFSMCVYIYQELFIWVHTVLKLFIFSLLINIHQISKAFNYFYKICKCYAFLGLCSFKRSCTQTQKKRIALIILYKTGLWRALFPKEKREFFELNLLY